MDGLELPQFSLAPRDSYEKGKLSQTNSEIELSGYPEFSQRYVLRGDAASRIHQLFSSDVVDSFRSRRDVHVEGTNNIIIFYFNPARSEKPQNWESLYNEASNLYQLLRVNLEKFILRRNSQ